MDKQWTEAATETQ